MAWGSETALVDDGQQSAVSGAGRAGDAAEALALIRQSIARYGRRIALVSSFGAESAALLELVAEVDRATPVIFLDTYQLFGETLDYRRDLVDRLGLTDVRDITPDAADLAREDPDNTLWQRDPDRCCNIRKVRPLERALVDFDAWFTGRKQHHGGDRRDLPTVEFDGRRTKVNPLAAWTPDDIESYFVAQNSPRHPLIGRGYPSIGCAPCTQPLDEADEDARAGRWQAAKRPSAVFTTAIGTRNNSCLAPIHQGFPIDYRGLLLPAGTRACAGRVDALLLTLSAICQRLLHHNPESGRAARSSGVICKRAGQWQQT